MNAQQITKSAGHVRSLDGIRALCILAVMGHHFGWCDPGWIGVEMFFVLSGFLITTLLCKENEKTGGIALGRFWARRAFRLLPGYWLYIGLTTLAILLRRPGDWADGSAWTPGMFIASMWGYFVNFAPPRMWAHQVGTYHLWSLALEEQFYFCWPFLCILALRLKRPFALPVLAFVISLAGRFIPMPGAYAWAMTYAPIGMIGGCTVALLFYFSRDGWVGRWCVSAPGRRVLAGACVAMLAVLAYRTRMLGDDAVRPWANRWLVPMYAFPFAALIGALWYGGESLLGRLLSLPPLVYLGKISYGMYLYHMVLIGLIKGGAAWAEARWGVHIRFALIASTYLACVTAVASLSYAVLEKPFLQIGARFRPQRPAAQPSSQPATLPLALNAEA